MSWQKLNIESAKINMSKVSPYDDTMTLLEEKQGFYHNNRLTALRKYATKSTPGYKCFRRAPTWLDGEYTSYIEINKIVDGELVHMLDISDSYYACAEYDYGSEADKPDFFSGVIFDDTLIGTADEWRDTVFYKLDFAPHRYICWNRDSGQIKVLTTFQRKKSQLDLNRTVDYIGNNKDKIYFNVAGDFMSATGDVGWVFFGQDFYDMLENAEEDSTYKPNEVSGKRKVGSQWAPIFLKTGTWSAKGYYIPRNRLSKVREITAELICDNRSKTLKMDGKTVVVAEFNDRGSEGTLTMLTGIKLKMYDIMSDRVQYEKIEVTAGDDNREVHVKFRWEYIWGPRWEDVRTMAECATHCTDDSITVSPISFYFLLSASHGAASDWYEQTWAATYMADENSPISSKYESDTKQTENGFVVNYTDKQQVSLGHRYKVIARLDTQGASYLGSDSKYAYVRQNGKTYRIWIATMFDVPYNSEVNIIENGDFCQRVGGYKIFNTTTYYNAIYNDNPEKICCSCDDWNGRYISTSADTEEPTLRSTSRVGHFWNKTASFDNIPAKAISSELTDQKEYIKPSYSWVNPSYTIHEGTKAYIYTQQDDQTDTMIQQWEISSGGFKELVDMSAIYAHNTIYQLVPSILFCNTLKSDAVYALQVGSEVHLLKEYAYSTTTPALVYDDEATAVNIDPSARYMIIQGAFYVSAGADDSIRIYNPYDTMMFEGVKTYCCDVTGLRYLGYDTTQAYYFSPATGVIYTFNGANKLNPFLEVDKRTPLVSGMTASGHIGIDVCNIPSMNIIGMAFSDGVLLIINGQSVFIEAQNVQTLEANKELGLIRINSDYYYFGTNSLAANIGTEVKDEAVELKLKTVRIGFGRLSNQTIAKHRIAIFSDTVDRNTKADVRITLISRLGDRLTTETYTKTVSHLDLVEGEFQWEFNPKQTKSNYIQVAVSMTNADLLEYWLDVNDSSEENLVR